MDSVDKSMHMRAFFFYIHLVELKIVCRIKYKNKIIGVYSEIEKSVVWRI